MSLSYSLAVADESVEHVVDLVLPDGMTRPDPTPSRRDDYRSATLRSAGFRVSAYRQQDAYIQLTRPELPNGIEHGQTGSPETWTPADNVRVVFTMYDDGPATSTSSVLAAVSRVMTATSGDAVFEGEGLLMARFGGRTHRYDTEWWSLHDRTVDEPPAE